MGDSSLGSSAPCCGSRRQAGAGGRGEGTQRGQCSEAGVASANTGAQVRLTGRLGHLGREVASSGEEESAIRHQGPQKGRVRTRYRSGRVTRRKVLRLTVLLVNWEPLKGFEMWQ